MKKMMKMELKGTLTKEAMSVRWIDNIRHGMNSCYLDDETPNGWKTEAVGTEIGHAILAGQIRRRRLLISLTCFFTLSFCKNTTFGSILL